VFHETSDSRPAMAEELQGVPRRALLVGLTWLGGSVAVLAADLLAVGAVARRASSAPAISLGLLCYLASVVLGAASFLAAVLFLDRLQRPRAHRQLLPLLACQVAWLLLTLLAGADLLERRLHSPVAAPRGQGLFLCTNFFDSHSPPWCWFA